MQVITWTHRERPRTGILSDAASALCRALTIRRKVPVGVVLICILLITGCGGSGSSPSSSLNSQTPPSTGNQPPSTGNKWTWVSGFNLVNQPGAYGEQGTPASSNVPPPRYGSATWTDASGKLWLFGGTTAATAGSGTYFNDLWKFSDGQWTWVGGSNTVNQPGVYGTLGVAAAGNIPGARSNAVTWTDKSGDVWLFGGLGLDAAGQSESLNDLWRYSGGEWTWMGGPQITTPGTPGSYGTKGVGAATNIPGGRSDAVAWKDDSGNFWLFGGMGEDSVGNWGELSDLWTYSNGQWTWVSGANTINEPGVYGALGTPDPANAPGARKDASAWMDASGNVWLFGGSYTQHMGTSATLALLNDLWKLSNGQWTWMGGSDQPNQPSVYGKQGIASTANSPGARSLAAAWADAAGNFWLFGGCCSMWANDLWKYSNGQWTWVGGSQANSPGTYGTIGVASSSNIPGSRIGAATWTDHSGNLWLFGGSGNDSTGTSTASFGSLNDLWKYQP